MKQNETYRHYNIRISIDEAAPFYSDTHQKPSYENLVKYFQSDNFSYDTKTKIVHFLNGIRNLNGIIEKYIYPIVSDLKSVGFEVKIPLDKTDDFETTFFIYICSTPKTATSAEKQKVSASWFFVCIFLINFPTKSCISSFIALYYKSIFIFYKNYTPRYY